ncbi:MAG: hypothetical protein ACOY3K_08070 [Candidatus Omnitrophota bacterium]
MVEAIKKHLKVLAFDRKKFHNAVLRRMGTKVRLPIEDRLKSFILKYPALIAQIYEKWESASPGSFVKKIGAFLINYLNKPTEFLPEEKENLLGHLDDAYLVGLVYEKILDHLVENQESISDEEMQFLNDFQTIKRCLRYVIPTEQVRIERLFTEQGERRPFPDVGSLN